MNNSDNIVTIDWYVYLSMAKWHHRFLNGKINLTCSAIRNIRKFSISFCYPIHNGKNSLTSAPIFFSVQIVKNSTNIIKGKMGQGLRMLIRKALGSRRQSMLMMNLFFVRLWLFKVTIFISSHWEFLVKVEVNSTVVNRKKRLARGWRGIHGLIRLDHQFLKI